MRLVFMGTPDFAVPPLRALQAAGHEVQAVYSQPPRPAGRGQAPRPSPVQREAERLGLQHLCPKTLRDEDLARHGAELAVVVAYGLILPQAALDAFPRGAINIHASLLPRWRGAAPIQRAIEAGDSQAGVTLMQMEAGLDTGPMLLKRSMPLVEGETTAGTLHDALSELGAEMIVEALAQLDALVHQVQDEASVTYAAKIDKAEARIDWSQEAERVARRINAFSPFPGAWFDLAGERVKALRARSLAGGQGAPGQVLSTHPLRVACGSGVIELVDLQRAGKRPLSAAELLRGWPDLAAASWLR